MPTTQAEYNAIPLLSRAYINPAGSWGSNPHEKLLLSQGSTSAAVSNTYYRLDVNTPSLYRRRSYEIRDGSNVLLQSGYAYFGESISYPATNSPHTPSRVYIYGTPSGFRLGRVGYFNAQPYYVSV